MNMERLVKESSLAIFDFDGTLFRIKVDWDGLLESLSSIGRRYGHIGGFRSLIEAYEWSTRIHRMKDRIIDVQNQYESEGVGSRLVIPHGAAAARWRLSEELPTAILSLNTSSTVEAVVGHWGFFPIVTVDRVERPKPHPEGLDLILRTLNIPPEEAVFIGNTDIDRECADLRSVNFIHVDEIKEKWFR